MVKQISILDEIASREERDKGITRAIKHADNVEDGWSDRAYKILIAFLNIHRGNFMAEEVRVYAEGLDFPEPPSKKAWGGVFVRAVHAGLIKGIGYGPVRNKKAHCTPARIWQPLKNVA